MESFPTTILTDVNVFVYAINESAPDHASYVEWINDALDGKEAFGVSEQVLSSVIRITTHQALLDEPLSIGEAIAYANEIRHHKNSWIVKPGSRHWDIFSDLCTQTQATGKVVPDAYFAALAIEHDCEWISADRGFAKFPGLRWRHPLDG